MSSLQFIEMFQCCVLCEKKDKISIHSFAIHTVLPSSVNRVNQRKTLIFGQPFCLRFNYHSKPPFLGKWFLIPIYGRKNHLVSKTGGFSYTNTISMIFSPFLVPSNRLKLIPFLTVQFHERTLRVDAIFTESFSDRCVHSYGTKK